MAITLSHRFSYSWPRGAAVDSPVEVAFVGDDPALADMYRLKLQVDGYAVTLFTTTERYPRAGDRPPDIVYLDVGFLNTAALATHRRLRALSATADVPIVLLSTRLARRELASRLQLGIHDFVISSDTMRPDAVWDEAPGAGRFGRTSALV